MAVRQPSGIKVLSGIRRPESGRVQGCICFVPRDERPLVSEYPSIRACPCGIGGEWTELRLETS